MRHAANKIIYKVLIAFGIAILFKLLFFRLPEVIGMDLIMITVIILIIGEGNKKIDRVLNSKYTWLENPKRRIATQGIAFMLFTSIALFILMFTLHQIKFGDGRVINRKMQEVFLPALFFALSIITIFIGYQFFMAWKESLTEVERYKTQSTEAQLQNLKNQINPHFLFNNLSVLTSLVYQNQDKAVDFINELSKVYRYVLDSKNSELVSLNEELDFLKHYAYLLKIRFDQAVVFSVQVDENIRQAFLPPMCLQMLVENAIQHNEASQCNPLHISVYTRSETLIIENNRQPRSDKPDSSKTGLKNIESRFSFFTDKKVEISSSGQIFKVILPLILKNESRHYRR